MRQNRRRARLLGDDDESALSRFDDVFTQLHDAETAAADQASRAEPRPPPRPNSPPSPPSWALPLYDTTDDGSSAAAPRSTASASQAVSPATPHSVVPTKVMVFVDGTWLYYQLLARNKKNGCRIAQRHGEDWRDRHHIDFARLPQLVSEHLSAELLRTQPHAACVVDVVRVLVFSSFRPDEAERRDELLSERQRMFRAMQALHYDDGPEEPRGALMSRYMHSISRSLNEPLHALNLEEP